MVIDYSARDEKECLEGILDLIGNEIAYIHNFRIKEPVARGTVKNVLDVLSGAFSYLYVAKENIFHK